MCDLVRPLFHSVYLMVKFCVHQHIRGRTGPSAQWHWRKKCDKSQPDLQLPQEQDVQKDQGEFLFSLPSYSILNFKHKCFCNNGWGHRLFSCHFSWTPFSELHFSLCLLYSDMFLLNCAGSFPVCPLSTSLRHYWEMVISPVFTFPSSLSVVHFIPHRYR